MVELPRCPLCRARILPGQRLVLDPDARLHHADCPKVFCPICSGEILYDEPIRRDGEQLIHGNCWMYRERQHVGVSAPAQRDRTAIIRSRVASGALPSVEPTKAWGGTSTGSICDGCTARILAGQIEYEVQFASTLVFRLHGACFMIWQQERGNVRREISGGSAASPWTLDDALIATAESRRVAAEMRDTSRRIRATSAALCAVAHAHDDCSVT